MEPTTEGTFASHWWAITLRGAFALLLGVLAFWWTGVSVRFLAVLLGVFMLIEAFFSGASAFRPAADERTPPAALLEGIVGVLFGAIALAAPWRDPTTLFRFVAGWIAAMGLLDAASAFGFRRHVETPRLLVAGGVVSLLAAAWLLLVSSSTILSLVGVGCWAIIDGALTTLVGWHLRRDVGADLIHPFERGVLASSVRPPPPRTSIR